MRRLNLIPLQVILFFALAVLAVPALAQSADVASQAVALFQSGQDAHEKGDIAAAIELYKKAIELLPEFPEAELQLGSALVSIGKTTEAESAFRKALALIRLARLLVGHPEEVRRSGTDPEAFDRSRCDEPPRTFGVGRLASQYKCSRE
jgi:tetratricopeptide (TPR) repeat protein